MANRTRITTVLRLLISLLLLRISLQDFICPLLCECQEVILTTDCSNGTSITHPTTLYNISSLSTVLLLERNDLTNVSDVILWSSLENVRKLSVASNRIEYFGKDTLSLMTKLVHIDMRNNSLDHVPEELRVLTRVKFLDLSDNLITYIETNDFLNFKELRTLRISNSLRVIARGAFSAFIQLETLILSGSDFSLMDRCFELGIWFGFSNSSWPLTELTISNANIMCVSDNTFHMFQNIRSIDVSTNSIIYLPRLLISGLKDLQRLTLSGNDILEIPVAFFAHSKALRVLDLSMNNLSSAQTINIRSLRRLEILNLKENNLWEISPLDFRILKNLIELNLMKSNIRQIPLVNNLRKLQNLDLSKNFITEVPSHALSNCRSLTTVNLNHNHGLKSFELDTTNLQSMDYFTMKRNNIHCDCNLLRYYEVLKKKYDSQLPEWLASMFSAGRCKLSKFDDYNSWYEAIAYLASDMICSHFTPPASVAVLVVSWLSIMVAIVCFIWAKSFFSAKRERKTETSRRTPYTKRRARRRVPRAHTGMTEVRLSQATGEPPPVWEELLPSCETGEQDKLLRVAGEKCQEMTETFV